MPVEGEEIWNLIKVKKMYLKISSMKGVVMFEKKGNLSPWYMGPYEIFQRAGKFVY